VLRDVLNEFMDVGGVNDSVTLNETESFTEFTKNRHKEHTAQCKRV